MHGQKRRAKNLQIDEKDDDLNSSIVLEILAPAQAIILSTTQISSSKVAEPIKEPETQTITDHTNWVTEV